MEEQTLNKFINKLDSNQRRLAVLVIAFFAGKMGNPNKIDSQTKIIIKSFVKIPSDKMTGSIPYDFITLLIFESKYQLSDFDADEVLLELLLGETDDPDKRDSIERCLDKLMRHIRLATFQYDYITKGIEKTEEALENANQKIKELSESTESSLETVTKTTQLSEEALKEARITADKVEQDKTKIYSEFIAILGIFTAISFALMGSIQTFGTVFSKVDNPSSASIGYAVIAGAIYLIIMIVLITVLFVGMQKVLKTRKEPFPWWSVNVSVFSILFLVIIGIILLRM